VCDLVTAVGNRARLTGQGTQLGQIQCRGVVTDLTDHRLLLHQRLIRQTGCRTIGVGYIEGTGVGRTRRSAAVTEVDIVGAVFLVVQPQDVDVCRPLNRDVHRYLASLEHRILLTIHNRQPGILQ